MDHAPLVSPLVVIAGVLLVIGLAIIFVPPRIRVRPTHQEEKPTEFGDVLIGPPAEGLFQQVVLKNTCPDCGGKGFYEGPHGGLSVNVFCKNRDCRSGFNVTQFGFRSGICERISQGDLRDYYPTERA